MSGKTQQPAGHKYRQIISDNFSFIEKQCSRAIRLRRDTYPSALHVRLENEAIELSNRVLDHLTRNDFQALRQFQYKSKLSTYLTAIIANHAVDLIRKKKGRSRESERAKKYGDLGKQVLQRIFFQGMPVLQAYKELKAEGNLKKSESEFESMVDDIRGKRIHPGNMLDPADNPVVKPGIQDRETGEVILVDNTRNPEQILLKDVQGQQVGQILTNILDSLSGEEKLILRMKYPFDPGQEPKKTETISRMLGISQKAVYKRIDRVLLKCRSELKKRGVSYHDLF